MGSAYQIQDQGGLYFFTFQVVDWADIFSRQIYRDIVLDSFSFCRSEKGMELFAYVIMTNHVHCIVQSKKAKLSELIRDFKRYTSRQVLKEIPTNPKESRKEWLEMIFKISCQIQQKSS